MESKNGRSILDSPGIAYYICDMLHSSSPDPNNLFKPVFSTNVQDLFRFDITTRKGEANHIVELNGIKHIYHPVYLTGIGGPSIKYKDILFSQLLPYAYCVFMTRDLKMYQIK